MPEERVRAGIGHFDDAGGVGNDHGVGRAFQDPAESAFRAGQFLGLPAKQLLASAELDEHADFALENFRDDRFKKEIDRAQIIPPKKLLIASIGGEEQNRRMTRPLAGPNQFRGLEAVDAGHSHVQKDSREIMIQA